MPPGERVARAGVVFQHGVDPEPQQLRLTVTLDGHVQGRRAGVSIDRGHGSFTDHDRTLLEVRPRRVVILGAPKASTREFDPERLRGFLAARGVEAEVEVVGGATDPAALLLGASRELGAGLLVAGAYGHPRLQEFIFGGATRAFLNADSPSLFLSH